MAASLVVFRNFIKTWLVKKTLRGEKNDLCSIAAEFIFNFFSSRKTTGRLKPEVKAWRRNVLICISASPLILKGITFCCPFITYSPSSCSHCEWKGWNTNTRKTNHSCCLSNMESIPIQTFLEVITNEFTGTYLWIRLQLGQEYCLRLTRQTLIVSRTSYSLSFAIYSINLTLASAANADHALLYRASTTQQKFYLEA